MTDLEALMLHAGVGELFLTEVRSPAPRGTDAEPSGVTETRRRRTPGLSAARSVGLALASGALSVLPVLLLH